MIVIACDGWSRLGYARKDRLDLIVREAAPPEADVLCCQGSAFERLYPRVSKRLSKFIRDHQGPIVLFGKSIGGEVIARYLLGPRGCLPFGYGPLYILLIDPLGPFGGPDKALIIDYPYAECRVLLSNPPRQGMMRGYRVTSSEYCHDRIVTLTIENTEHMTITRHPEVRAEIWGMIQRARRSNEL